MDLKLAIFDYCPYCQRVRILLEYYGLEHELLRLSPDALPEWFLAASPYRRVPLLIADGVPILESAVIGEFLDEIGGGRLIPAAPLARAQIRGWVAFASECQTSFGGMVRAADEEAFVSARTALHADLARVDQALHESGPFFRGSELCMADVAFAPLLSRLLLLDGVVTCFPAELSRLRRFAEALVALPAVSRSVDDDPRGALVSMVEHLGPQGYVASRLAAA
jgi:glutathione S-transferase